MTKFYPSRGKVAIKYVQQKQSKGPIIYEEKRTGVYGVGYVISIGLPVIMKNGKETPIHYQEGQLVAYENRKENENYGDFILMDQNAVVLILDDAETRIG